MDIHFLILYGHIQKQSTIWYCRYKNLPQKNKLEKCNTQCSLIRCTVRSLYSTPYNTAHPTGSLYMYTSQILWLSRHLYVCTCLQVQIDIETCLSSVTYNHNSLKRSFQTIKASRIFTAFILWCGIYQFRRLPFDPKRAPSHFQEEMASIVLAG